MNERIRELAEQAAKPENRMNFVTYGKLTNEKLIEFAIQSGVHPSYLDPENPENSLTGSLNKFAELIVRECAELSVNSQYTNTKSEYYEGFNEALIYAGNKIRKHFGVEK